MYGASDQTGEIVSEITKTIMGKGQEKKDVALQLSYVAKNVKLRR